MTDEPQWDPEEPTPAYLRARFVLGVVVLAAVLALAIYALGNSGNVVLTPEGEVVPSVPEAAQDSEEVPEAATAESCPAPGPSVDLEAAELVSLFAASATGGGFSSLPATDEVVEQIDATSPAPPVSRMTRIRGFSGGPGNWSTCVVSTWTGPEGPMQSLDVVTVQVVDADDRSDSGNGSNSEDEDDTRSSRREKDLEDRWEVTSWLRGVPEPAPPQQVATVAFYNSKRSCRRPDRPASVPVAEGAPGDRLVAVLEELVSGTPGRANTAASKVPPDIQVIEAEVADGRARVVLSPTADDGLSRCDGTAGYEQVRDTAAAIAAETLPPASDDSEEDDRDVTVEVIVEGEEVTTLAR